MTAHSDAATTILELVTPYKVSGSSNATSVPFIRRKKMRHVREAEAENLCRVSRTWRGKNVPHTVYVFRVSDSPYSGWEWMGSEATSTWDVRPIEREADFTLFEPGYPILLSQSDEAGEEQSQAANFVRYLLAGPATYGLPNSTASASGTADATPSATYFSAVREGLLSEYHTLAQKRRLGTLSPAEQGSIDEIRHRLNQMDAAGAQSQAWRESCDRLERELAELREQASRLPNQ